MKNMGLKSKKLIKDIVAVSPVIAVILMVAITVVLAGVLYVWVTGLSGSDDKIELEMVTGDARQGPGNKSVGCLVEIQKSGGRDIRIADYTIKIGKAGMSSISLKWSKDGNTSYDIDSKQRPDDDKWWDSPEIMGFDAPPELSEVLSQGDTIVVDIIKIDGGEIIFEQEFQYAERPAE